ncbi:MAG: DUF5009 domain-containing protein [Bacteroidota bacterium]
MDNQKRLLSIDALRGFDMLLIAGGGTFITLLKGVTNQSWIDTVADQLEHPAWNGFTFYDFIFPLFLFTAGVSLSFSIQSGLRKGMQKKELYKKAFKRLVILILLGIIDKNIPLNIFDPAQIRIGTVLGRIGVATFVATVLYLNFSWKGRMIWIGAILTFYCAALYLIPVPGYGAGDLSFEGNLVGWIDRHVMPGRLLQKTYDENALLTQLPALCLTIAGSLAGDVLQLVQTSTHKIIKLVVPGIAAIGAGILWGQYFPLNKHLWTSSFILLTSGMSLLFLALFYWLIDVMQYQRWAFFFKVIGMNSIVVYLAYRFIDFGYTSRLLFSGFYMHAAEKWQPALNALGALALVWIFLYILYRNKIFVKI